MNPQDKQEFQKGRPYIIGIVALLLKLRFGGTAAESFDEANEFVQEFEQRT